MTEKKDKTKYVLFGRRIIGKYEDHKIYLRDIEKHTWEYSHAFTCEYIYDNDWVVEEIYYDEEKEKILLLKREEGFWASKDSIESCDPSEQVIEYLERTGIKYEDLYGPENSKIDEIFDRFPDLLPGGSQKEIEERIATARSKPLSPTHRLRYYFEHRFIPERVYKDGVMFISSITSEDNYLNDLFKEKIYEIGLDGLYSEEVIRVERHRNEGITIIEIQFPPPEEEPLCYKAFIFYDAASKRIAYYCMEKRVLAGDKRFLCGWNKMGEHVDYRVCSDSEDELFDMMMSIFKENK